MKVKLKLKKTLQDPTNKTILTLCLEKPRRPIELAEILKRSRVAIDKRAAKLIEQGLLKSYLDERGRKYYEVTEKGKWCLENYLKILMSNTTEKPQLEGSTGNFSKALSRLIKSISPMKIIPLIPLIIGIQGYVKFAFLEKSLQRGLIVLLFWLSIAILTYFLLTKIEKKLMPSNA